MKSSTKTKSLDPEWDERFEMDVDEPSESLEVRLYDYDVTSADDFMGLVRQGSRHHHRRRRHDHRPQTTAHPPTYITSVTPRRPSPLPWSSSSQPLLLSSRSTPPP